MTLTASCWRRLGIIQRARLIRARQAQGRIRRFVNHCPLSMTSALNASLLRSDGFDVERVYKDWPPGG
jgi:hypothetical protein